MSGSAKKEIVIKDACILIDLIDLGLLTVFYQLDLIVITTPLVIAEITEPQQIAEVNWFVNSGQLQIDSNGELAVMTAITTIHRGLSLADASVVEVANRIGATVLSSDGSLRNVSMREGLVVRGLLWVLEELYLQQLIGLRVLLEKLEQYAIVNKRAPVKEISQLLVKYSDKP